MMYRPACKAVCNLRPCCSCCSAQPGNTAPPGYCSSCSLVTGEAAADGGTTAALQHPASAARCTTAAQAAGCRCFITE